MCENLDNLKERYCLFWEFFCYLEYFLVLNIMYVLVLFGFGICC